MVDPWETDWVKFVDVNAILAEGGKMALLQRLVIGVVTETVEQSSDFNAFAAFLTQDVKKQEGNGVIAEVEVLQMNAAAGLPYGFEHIIEFLLTAHEQLDTVAFGEAYAVLLHLLAEDSITRLLRKAYYWKEGEDGNYHPRPSVVMYHHPIGDVLVCIPVVKAQTSP